LPQGKDSGRFSLSRLSVGITIVCSIIILRSKTDARRFVNSTIRKGR
jgi:hypothetical protein